MNCKRTIRTIVTALVLTNLIIVGLVSNLAIGRVKAQTDQAQVEHGEKLKQIPGNPDAEAWDALPRMDYDFTANLEQDYVLSDEGYFMPKNIMDLAFTADATIQDVNFVLKMLKAEIVGVLPGNSAIGIGLMLTVRVQTEGFDELQNLTKLARRLPSIEIAVESIFDGPLN